MRVTTASRHRPRKGSTPLASMSANVTRHSLGRRCWPWPDGGSRRGSIVPAWTYRPQNRQDGQPSPSHISSVARSADREAPLSCRPCLPFVRGIDTVGSLRSTGITPLPRSTDPSATLSSSVDFPGSPVLRPPLFRRFPGGMRRSFPVAGVSLSPCCRSHPARAVRRVSQSARAHAAFRRVPGSASGALTFGATCAFACATAWKTRPHPADECGREASEGWFPVPLLSELQGSGFSPGRVTSYDMLAFPGHTTGRLSAYTALRPTSANVSN